MQTGYLTLGRVRGALVRIHWSAFALALLLGYSRGAFLPSLFSSLLVLVLIVIHEFGHAFMVWRYRHQVIAIEVFAFHGWCRWDGHPSRYESAMISWGGVFAQLALLVPAVAIAIAFPQAGRPVLLDAAIYTFVWTNLFLVCINLIPIAPLDGAEAWKLVPLLRGRRAQRPTVDDLPFRGPTKRPPAQGGQRPNLRVLTPPPEDDEPVSESSRRIADSAIKDALERSRRKFKGRDDADD